MLALFKFVNLYLRRTYPHLFSAVVLIAFFASVYGSEGKGASDPCPAEVEWMEGCFSSLDRGECSLEEGIDFLVAFRGYLEEEGHGPPTLGQLFLVVREYLRD